MDLRPLPTDDEAAAIAAAIDAMWPRRVAMATKRAERESPWRFSGRWWAKPIAARRDRPFV